MCLPQKFIEHGVFEFTSAGNRKKYAFCKIKNAINFVRLIKEIEAKEREYFNHFVGEQGEINSYDNYSFGGFVLYEDFQKTVYAAVERIIMNANNTENFFLINSVRRFLEII